MDRLSEIGQYWGNRVTAPRLAATQQILTPNLASERLSSVSSIADTSGPDLANDDKPATYWLCGDGQTPGWIEIDLQKSTKFYTIAVVYERLRARQPRPDCVHSHEKHRAGRFAVGFRRPSRPVHH